MNMFWLILIVLVVMAGTCEAMTLIYGRRELWQARPKYTWWIKLISNVLAVCIGVLLMFIHGSALS